VGSVQQQRERERQRDRHGDGSGEELRAVGEDLTEDRVRPQRGVVSQADENAVRNRGAASVEAQFERRQDGVVRERGQENK
jgi:hypothetical protein